MTGQTEPPSPPVSRIAMTQPAARPAEGHPIGNGRMGTEETIE